MNNNALSELIRYINNLKDLNSNRITAIMKMAENLSFTNEEKQLLINEVNKRQSYLIANPPIDYYEVLNSYIDFNNNYLIYRDDLTDDDVDIIIKAMNNVGLDPRIKLQIMNNIFKKNRKLL